MVETPQLPAKVGTEARKKDVGRQRDRMAAERAKSPRPKWGKNRFGKKILSKIRVKKKEKRQELKGKKSQEVERGA